MPLVRMLTDIADRNYALSYDDEVEVTAGQASEWLAAGIAELVVEERMTPERGQRSEKRGPGRPRKYPPH
jgi:hypothetical protein